MALKGQRSAKATQGACVELHCRRLRARGRARSGHGVSVDRSRRPIEGSRLFPGVPSLPFLGRPEKTCAPSRADLQWGVTASTAHRDERGQEAVYHARYVICY
eukprot:scaffold5127_cov64-Phaeocystis_antarctica.AAC.6